MADGGIAAGGTALYAGVAAGRLGVPAALVTALAPGDADLLAPAAAAGVQCQVLPSPATTTFALSYAGENRQLILHSQAAILRPEDVPPAWRSTAILHLGPVAAELDPTAAWDTCCPGALCGVTPQGWMRTWDTSGLIRPAPWAAAARVLAWADVLVMSLEDVGNDEEILMGYVEPARLAVVTAGTEGATLYERGRRTGWVPSYRAQPIDFTGAGDVFAAAFLVGYQETGDPRRAAAFAHAAAAFAIEGRGTTGIAPRAAVDARHAANDTQ